MPHDVENWLRFFRARPNQDLRISKSLKIRLIKTCGTRFGRNFWKIRAFLLPMDACLTADWVICAASPLNMGDSENGCMRSVLYGIAESLEHS